MLLVSLIHMLQNIYHKIVLVKFRVRCYFEKNEKNCIFNLPTLRRGYMFGLYSAWCGHTKKTQ